MAKEKKEKKTKKAKKAQKPKRAKQEKRPEPENEPEPGRDAGSVAAALGAPAAAQSTQLAGLFTDVPATVEVRPHDAKPPAKRKSSSKRRRLSQLASAPSAAGGAGSGSDDDTDSEAEAGAARAGAAAEEEGINDGWKARMVQEKKAGITAVRDGRTPAEVRAEREKTQEARTVFVGNLPLTHAKKKRLKKLFADCGKIESVRFRSFTASDLRMPKKAAFINGAFHEQRDACNAYVVFRSDDDAVIEAALAKNNQKVEDHHIRVDRAARTSESGSNKRSVFVGNLPFDVSEEELRAHFAGAGLERIENVRVVRDPKTGLGKGIAFVAFATEETAVAALRLHESTFGKGKASKSDKGRPLRVYRASAKLAAQAHKRGHTNDGHSGTVGNPMEGGRGRGRGARGGRGGLRGGRGGSRGRGRGRGADSAGFQGAVSQKGFIPESAGAKRKSGGHGGQKKKSKRR